MRGKIIKLVLKVALVQRCCSSKVFHQYMVAFLGHFRQLAEFCQTLSKTFVTIQFSSKLTLAC